MHRRCTRILWYGAFALIALCSLCDACLSLGRSRTRESSSTLDPSATLPPPIAEPTTTAAPRPNVTFPTYSCPAYHDAWYCMNDAKCFAVDMNGQMLYYCMCPIGFEGQRCELKEISGIYIPGHQRVMLEKASILSGATLALFIAFVCCAFLYMRHGKRVKAKLHEREMCAHENCGMDQVDGLTIIPQLRPFGPHHQPIMTLAQACRR